MRKHGDNVTTLYLNNGSLEYIIYSSGKVSSKVYIHTGSYSPAAQVEITESSAPNYSYYIADSLGSALRCVNDSSIAQPVTRYNVWGETVNAMGNEAPMNEKHKGFTGHENLENTRLIHMNGRVFDPLIAQFIAPDPIVSNPSRPNNLNRYAYIENNPLVGTDPSGLTAEFTNAFRLTEANRSTYFAAEHFSKEMVW